ncbi:MAG TPA: enoyl-CoA hydratase/isomerase family protein [Xanthobacteraceae bacterium]|jgi:enoyl-CoA hydratase/carnithine racemase
MSMIKSARDGAVATITLDRVAEGNLLPVDGVRELTAAFRAAGESDAKVIVLRGNGADFCRGRDPRGGVPSPTAMKMRVNVLEPILDAYDAMMHAPQPIVGVVQGVAHGFGAAIAGACDLTVAHDNARFRLPEMEKDLPPTLAVSALMPRVSHKALAWMVYSMDELDAHAAQQIGIVSKVVPSAQVEGEVAKLLATMTARSPEALVAMKDFFRSAPHMEPRGMADYAANLLASVLSSAGK